MKALCFGMMIMFLYITVACASLDINQKTSLQFIDFIESEYFLEGAEFELSKEKRGCSLIGIGYGETGQNQYEFYFDDSGLIDAHYTSYRYPLPIYEVKNDADIVKAKEVAYGNSLQEDAEFLDLFNKLTKLIAADNLSSCNQ